MRFDCTCCGVSLTRRHLLAAFAAVPFARGARAASPPSLDAWLQGQPRIAKLIVWEESRGALSYWQWPEPRKAALRTAFDKAWMGAPSGLTDPPPLTVQPGDNNPPGRSIPETNAFALYCALVGNSIATELNKRVPWSILRYDDASLAQLFDARALYTMAPRPHEYLIGSLDDPLPKLGIPAPPEVAVGFLRQQGILSANPRATVFKLAEWCRDQLWHFTGSA